MATYSFTSEIDNISMIRASFHANLRLIDLLYPMSATNYAGSSAAVLAKPSVLKKAKEDPELERFEAHSAIYRNLFLSIFAFHSSSVPFMTLAFQLLPVLVERLGIGSLRFSSDTLPSLTAALGASPAGKGLVMLFSPQTVQLYEAALLALCALYAAMRGSGRMARWRGSILASLGVLLCNIVEGQGMQGTPESTDFDLGPLKQKLRDVVEAVREDGGQQAHRDIQRMRDCDPALFDGLF